MYLHLVVDHVERHVRHMQEVVREELLDQVTAVAATNDELVDTMKGVQLHDVPKDRMTTDLDHWLGPQDRLLGESRSQPASKNHCFHTFEPISSFTVLDAETCQRALRADYSSIRKSQPVDER